MKGDKPVIRRTLSQERFEVLIKKQKAGQATFRDLTELDEIVNRVPDIKLSILEEMEGQTRLDDDINNDPLLPQNNPQPNIIQKIKLFFERLLNFHTATLPL